MDDERRRDSSWSRRLLWLPAGYLVVGLAWILGSDRALGWLFQGDPASLIFIGTLKGVLFVVVTTVLIYIVVALRMDTGPNASADGLDVPGPLWQPLAVFLVAGLTIATAGYAVYGRQAAAMYDMVARELVLRAEIKAGQIEQWREERTHPLRELVQEPYTPEFVAQWRSSGDDAAKARVIHRLEALRVANRYAGVALFDADGNRLLGVGVSIDGGPALREMLERARSAGDVVDSDIVLQPRSGEATQEIDFAVWLAGDSRTNAQPTAVVARGYPAWYIKPLLDKRSTSFASGASLLVRRDGDQVTYLGGVPTPSGARAGNSVPVSRTELAVVRVALGERGVIEAQDERGAAVMAAGVPVAGTQWWLVTKADRREVFAPLQQLFAMTSILAGAAVLAAAGLVMLWWRGERLRASLELARAEARADALAQRFGAVNRHAHDVILLLDEQSRIVDANERAEQAYGYSRDELLRMSVFDLREQDDDELDLAQRQLSTVRDRGQLLFETRHRRKDGTAFPVEVNSGRVDVHGVTYVQSVIRDVSERKQQEARIAEIAAQRDRMLALRQQQFDRMPIGCAVRGPGISGVLVNPAFERIFGYSRDELQGPEAFGLIVPPEIRDEIQRALEGLEQGDDTLVLVNENLTRKGPRIVCRWTNTPLRSERGEFIGVMSMCENITEQVAAERALSASEQNLRVLADVSPVGIFHADPNGNCTYVNARFCEITGVVAEAAYGEGWKAVVLAEDRERVVKAVRSTARRRALQEEFRVSRPDGRVIWVLAQARPQLGEDQQPTGYVGTLTDIDDLKRTQSDLEEARAGLEQRVAERTRELVDAKDRAERADKVKSSFLSMMSHELRTPLNSILGFTNVILQGYSGPLTPDQERQLAIVRDSSLHLLDLINDVLDVSRIEAGQLQLEIDSVELPDLVRRRVQAFEAQATAKGLSLECRVAGDVGTIRSDAKRVSQIVANLVSNAVKFTERGRVTVDLRSGGDGVRIDVSDTGVGIAADLLPRLFTAFERLGAAGRGKEGTGLGLAISRHLARALGGDIEVASELGRGSRFSIVLPLVSPAAVRVGATGVVRAPSVHHDPAT